MLILIYASVAQLDRAQDSDSWCRGFKSCQTRQKSHSKVNFAMTFFNPILCYINVLTIPCIKRISIIIGITYL